MSQNANVGRDNNGIIDQSQIYGDQGLASLLPEQLLEEEVLAKRVIRSERTYRFKSGGIFGVVALGLIAIGYAFFLRRGDLSFADVFNGFSPTLMATILPFAIPWLVALGSGLFAFLKLSRPTDTEMDNVERLPVIENIILSKGISRRDLKKMRKSSNRTI